MSKGLFSQKSVAVWLSLGVAGWLALGANIAGIGAPPLPGAEDAAPLQTAGRIDVETTLRPEARIPLNAPAQGQNRISIDDTPASPLKRIQPETHPNQTGTLDAADVQVASTVKQGEVLRVEVLDTTYFVRNNMSSQGTVTFADKKVPFFQQGDGTFLALAPVSVFEKPGVYPLTIQDPNGPTIFRRDVEVKNAWYRTQNVSVSKSTEGLQPLPGEIETIQKLKDTLTPVKFWSEPFITPTPDCQNSPFGVKRYHNGKATGDYHKGVDLRSPAGRPIRATSGGRVQIATMYRLHGGTVGIDHGQGIGSIYIHMSKVAVKPGDMVKKGDVIGYVGSTGFASGPHLHWGLYVNGLPVNPNQWIHGVPSCG